MGDSVSNSSTSQPAIQTQQGLIHLGFLTIQQEQGAWLGGYLVTNAWGRPLEFRLTSAIQPSRVQQILYGPTLEPHLVSELIGRTLIEKAGVAAHVVICDHPDACFLSGKIGPAIVLMGMDAPLEGFKPLENAPNWAARLQASSHDLLGAQFAASTLGVIASPLDLLEPFNRTRDAIQEARRMGGALRAG